MAATMKRVKLTEARKTVIEEVPVPEPAEGEALMQVAYCGICGSDMHASIGRHPFVPLPATPGHEFSGRIVKTGPGVDTLKAGDRVSVEPNLVCGGCYNCRTGRYNICEELRVMGCQGEGAMAEYFLFPAGKAVHVPDSVSLEHAVLAEPLAVGVHAVHKAGDLYNKNVFIAGAGMIGLAVLVSAVRAGAAETWVSDLDEDRLAAAKRLGASRLLRAGGDTAGRIRREAGFEGVDAAFECVGVGEALRSCMETVRKGAKIIVAGVFGEDSLLPTAIIQDRELELIGTLMYTMRDFKEALDILSEDDFPAASLIGRTFALEEADAAFEYARNNKKEIKILLEINPEV